MKYPFLTLEDGTVITHSVKQADASVLVYIEKPDAEDGFHHATCVLPSYRWDDVFGFDEAEVKRYEKIVESTAHLIMEFSETGGFENASKANTDKGWGAILGPCCRCERASRARGWPVAEDEPGGRETPAPLASHNSSLTTHNSSSLTMVDYFNYESVVSALPLSNGIIEVLFRDGSRGEFDCKPYFDKEFWKPLQDEALFRQVYVEAGTLVWPNDIDIAPEEVWHNSKRI